MPVYNYEIGSTLAGLANVETLLVETGYPRGTTPRGQYFEFSILNDRGDGHVSGHGFPYAVWTFDVLTVSMVNTLRQFCLGTSADIWIRTRVPPDELTSTDQFRIFRGIMIWPTQEYLSRRQMGGKYLGLEFTFRRLEPRFGAFSSAFSSAFDVVQT